MCRIALEDDSVKVECGNEARLCVEAIRNHEVDQASESRIRRNDLDACSITSIHLGTKLCSKRFVGPSGFESEVDSSGCSRGRVAQE